ncbi:trypsin-like serine protease [Pseudoalteromonas sp. MTN2-4]|uniref:trypsin-like serine protease n=1 Tax=Pseudoalteromonas sp. MTN2-4 TaxID=3056555 RepID=UPI0036F324C9
MNLIRKLIIGGLITTSLHANAMIIRHDVNDDKYVQQASDYLAIFPLKDDGKTKNCVGTLLAAQWAVTAAHCTILLEPGSQLEIAGNKTEVQSIHLPPEYGYMKAIKNEQGKIINIEDKVKDPSFDIALLRLKQPIENAKTFPLLESKVKENQIIEVMGWGDFGDGAKGVSRQERVNDRQLRVAHNKIDVVDGNYLIFNFDAPNSKNVLPLEGINGPGDSGSPALVKLATGYYIAGISSGGDYPEPQAQHQREGKYGWQEYYISVNALSAWISKTMALKIDNP